MRVTGANSIAEALKAGVVNKIYIGEHVNPRLAKILAEAKKQKIPIVKVKNLKRVEADVSPIKYYDFDFVVEKALKENGFLLFLDSIQDPQNLGAVLRTAEFFGCSGVVIPKRRAVQVTETVVEVSQGAAFHLKISRVENLANAIKKIKKYGFLVVGAEIGGDDLRSVKFTPPLALVVGGEDRGISQPVKKRCDFLVEIKGVGKTPSLNLSVAAGILLYEVRRQL